MLSFPRCTPLPSPALQIGARVLGLSLNRQGSMLLVNCHDRAIRLFELRPRSELPQAAQRGLDEKQLAKTLVQPKAGREGGRGVGDELLVKGGPDSPWG